jgi:LysM repeat protein
MRRLEGRLEGYDLAIQQLQQAVEIMRARPNGPSDADLQALQTRLSALDGQLRSLDAARQRDRQEIVDTLSTKIASLVNASARQAPRAPAAAPKRSANQEGFEHVVASGETLSAIAAAYNSRAKDIMDANNITKPESLRVGQKLFIPAP